MRVFVYSFALFILANLSANAQDQTNNLALGQFHALIIGNNNYTDPQGHWQNLSTPGENAESLATILRQRFDFENVVLLRNANKSELNYAFERISSKVSARDSVLIYYAGHGQRVSSKQTYWIPSDAIGGKPRTYFDTRLVEEYLNTLSKRTKHVLLISDAPFTPSALEREDTHAMSISISPRFFPKLSARKSAQAIIRLDARYVDQASGEYGRTLLSDTLFQVLESSNTTVLTLQEVLNHTLRQLPQSAREQVAHGKLKGADNEGGEFMFTRVRGKSESEDKHLTRRQASVSQRFDYNSTPILPVPRF